MFKFLKDLFGMTPPAQAIIPVEPPAPVQPVINQPPAYKVTTKTTVKKETAPKKTATKPAKITGVKKETAKKAPAKPKKK